MNWLEKHRKKIENMKMPETIIRVSLDETQILRHKFRGNEYVKEICLPKTIQYIEKTAFRNCISLGCTHARWSYPKNGYPPEDRNFGTDH